MPVRMKRIMIVFVLLSCFYSSCNKCEDIACTTPPEPFLFKMADKTGKNMSASFTNAVLRYTETGLTKEIKLIKTITSGQEVIFTSNELGWISAAMKGERSFDLLLDEKARGKVGCEVIQKSENCCSFFKTEKITFNEISILGKKDRDFSYLLMIE